MKKGVIIALIAMAASVAVYAGTDGNGGGGKKKGKAKKECCEEKKCTAKDASTTSAAAPQSTTADATAAATAEPAAPVIVGNPPADQPFGKLKIGMSYDEVIAIVGKPSSESSWCTGKQHIPFYFGNDKGRAQAIFKGMGKLEFNASVTLLPFRICKGSTPLDLVYVEYNPDTAGEAAK